MKDMYESGFSKAFDELLDLQKKLDRLKQRQNLRNILKIFGIGFLLYRNIQVEIEDNIAFRKAMFERILSEAQSRVDYFYQEILKIKESATYLPTEKEAHFLGLFREFERDLAYLKVLDTGRQIPITDALSRIGNFQNFISNYNRELEKKQLNEQLLKLKNEVLQAETEFKSLLNGSDYFSKRELYEWKEKWGSLVRKTDEYTKKIGFEVNFGESIKFIISAFSNGENWLENRNREFVKQEIIRFEDFFNRVESKPLTLEQRKAIVTDEANNLVVAGAGTGKTSTIIGKAIYLIQKGLAKPNEILLLSFNKAVAEELEKRLSNKPQANQLTIKTYHSFGLQVISHATKIKPSVSKLAEDKTNFSQKLSEFLNKRMTDKAFAKMVNEYFLYHLIPYRSEFDFDSFGEYIRYLRQYDLKSLKADRVKSFEECYIANFLYLNGIEYVYEPKYEISTVNQNYRQYKPDFYLPKYRIYIEHFGVNRNGKPARFISEQEYRQQMNWKRTIHAQNRTTLVETYSYEQKEGALLKNLEAKLIKKGVVFSPIPVDQVFDELNRSGRISQFPTLLSNFLNLYKASGKTISQIQNEVPKDNTRTLAFLKIFSAIYDDYTSYLKTEEEIDFNDMLNYATKYIVDGKYLSHFKYVLVDEFQDISQSRFMFLTALLSQNGAKLFCVGDDWQSIYRFTGSDISLMADFKRKFKFSEILYLQETFRFNQRISNFSSQFILKNPLQIKKRIVSKTTIEKPAVTVIRARTEEALKDIMANLSRKSEKPETVFVIGRYNWLEEEYLGNLPKKVGSLSVEYFTAHSSKGLEADYVIIIGLNGGRMGFPCQITDDPLLSLVLAEADPFPNAEERRLFYVAATRAKRQVFLIDDPTFNSSSFLIEILDETYDVESVGQLPESAFCPICKTGEMVKKQNDRGTFYACSNYPYCEYIAHHS